METNYIEWPVFPEDRDYTAEELRDYFSSHDAIVAVSMNPEWAISVIIQMLDRIIKAKSVVGK